MKYKVWHIPQIPGKPFEFFTDDINVAKVLINVLADYDLFQYNNNIKPDYCNANGICAQDEDGWCDLDEDEIYDLINCTPTNFVKVSDEGQW